MNRGPLVVLNDSKWILINDQGVYSGSFTTDVESFITFRGSLFLKKITFWMPGTYILVNSKYKLSL